jgi:hypothetical protein
MEADCTRFHNFDRESLLTKQALEEWTENQLGHHIADRTLTQFAFG